jgi:hypothetical protein
MIATLHSLYTAMWSNMWAPSIPSAAMFAVHHVALRRHITKTAAKQDGEQP